MAGAAPYPVHAQRAHPGRGLAFPVGIDADGNAVCEALSHVFLVFRRCKVITLQPKSQEKSKNSLVHDMFFLNRWVEGLATDMFCHARASEGLGTVSFPTKFTELMD